MDRTKFIYNDEFGNTFIVPVIFEVIKFIIMPISFVFGTTFTKQNISIG